MNLATIELIQHKLQPLDDHFADDILEFITQIQQQHIDFTNDEILSIQQGEKDFQENKTYTPKEVENKINAFIHFKNK